jgi:hypothetical protein
MMWGMDSGPVPLQFHRDIALPHWGGGGDDDDDDNNNNNKFCQEFNFIQLNLTSFK